MTEKLIGWALLAFLISPTSLAEGILASAAWRDRSGDAGERERLLGRLMQRALAEARVGVQ